MFSPHNMYILFVALNNGCFEGDDVINPDFVLNALGSHGWVIPTDQQVSE